jgi:hypothetical protein
MFYKPATLTSLKKDCLNSIVLSNYGSQCLYSFLKASTHLNNKGVVKIQTCLDKNYVVNVFIFK